MTDPSVVERLTPKPADIEFVKEHLVPEGTIRNDRKL